MRRYSITFREEDYNSLVGWFFPADTERAAYLLCRLSVGPEETKLLVREVVPVQPEEIRVSSRTHLSIPATTFTKWLKRADDSRQCVVFVHSHPAGVPNYSLQDDIEEPEFFRTAYNRIHHDGVHGSLVLSSPTEVKGRVWLRDGSGPLPLECIRIIGRRFRFVRDYTGTDAQFAFFDRQVRAFGHEFQPVLRELRVGVVGCGGTGSSVCEQLIRLGVGHLTVIDGERFDSTNVNRVYGSLVTDREMPKPLIVKRMANAIGLETTVTAIEQPISFKSAMLYLKDCDIVFGCTDDQWGRSLLTTFAVHYITPVIDMGIAIVPDGDKIERVEGRVTILMPGTACLFCRRRINPDGIREQTMRELDPAQAQQLREEGYLLGIPETAPSVIAFTTTIAASAITELLDRLTGFMGPDRTTSEILHRIDWNTIRTNSTPSKEDCFCANRETWGRGDSRPFLGVSWRQEP